MHRRKLLSLLDVYAHEHPEEVEETQRFINFVEQYERCFHNDFWAGHVTGSAWVVDPDRTRVLLTHHRKLGKWLQLGGHSDGDPDIVAVATREAEEESGLSVECLSPEIFDLDIHEIPARKNDPAHFHFDVRFAFVARTDGFKVSSESNQLAWVPMTDLRQFTEEESILRMQRKWLGLTASTRL